MGDGMRDRNKTTKIGTLPEVEKAKKKSYWDQRIVLLAEVSATVISLLLFWIGLKIKNEIIVGIFSNSFTALLVTIVGTLVSWNTETDIEKAVRAVEEETSTRIQAIQSSTAELSNELVKDVETTREMMNALEQGIATFNRMVEAYNGKTCTFCKNYIKDIRFSRSDCDLKSFFQSAKDSISILATNLESFVPFLPLLSSLSETGINVRVATIHPNYARDFNIARVTGSTTPEQRWHDMKDSLMKFVAFSETKNSFFVRTYSEVAPTLIMMMADNNCYVAYLLHGMRARDTIHFLFTLGEGDLSLSPVYYFKKHFDSIWNDDGTKDCVLSDIVSIKYNERE